MSRVWLPVLLLVGCGPAEAPVKPAASVAQAPKEEVVGYDLRRLRPRDGEALAATFDRLREQAVADGKRVAVLFSADWCAPCRDLETELGNRHPAAKIGAVQILEIKEEDWKAATRMDEFDALRRRWSGFTGSYPLLVLLDAAGQKQEEMKEAIDRLTAAGVEPTLANWLADTRPQASG
jgi:thiol-disulfide isomerase/thioredoxin